MRRRRKGPRASWFPLNGTFFNAELNETWYENVLLFTSGAEEEGDTTQVAIPVTLDSTPDINTETDLVLGDYVQGQDWLCERVVGKVWGAHDYDSSARVSGSIFCAALAVLPVDSVNPDQPAIDEQEWNPLFTQNAQQPWLWRRTWRLSNTQSQVPGGDNFPASTANYGSVADGGHLDTKGVKRRISKEQRLFVIFAAAVARVQQGQTGGTGIQYGYDFRILGRMMRGNNKSVF